MDLDLLLLSRIQFALTVMFHYLFPPLTIGLGAVMVATEAMYLRTKDPQYEVMAKFWTKMFGVNFAMGVASGIVMEFQFGTNWATYSRFVGDVFGSALAAEGIFAFFLESGFLAVLVFGWDRVSPKVHFFSTVMVALGSMFSAVWIVVANSWQQTPAGYKLVENVWGTRAEITDFWALVFNPSSPIRLTHVIIGGFILGAFFVMSITGYYILKGRHVEMAKKSFAVALIWACISSFGQLFAGHYHGQVVAKHQPAKLAAFEAIYKTEPGGTPLTLFGIPDGKSETIRAAIQIPNLLSWLAYNDPGKPVTGLDKFPKEDRPPVLIPFVTYHVMIALGMYFIGLTSLGVFLLWRRTLFDKRWLLWVFVFSVIAPYVANQFGWVAAEVGRQPWIVQGLLRTGNALSKSVHEGEVLSSIVMFCLIYIMLIAVWIYVMDSKIKHGPDPEDAAGARKEGGLLGAIAALEPGGTESLTMAKQGEVHEEEEGR